VRLNPAGLHDAGPLGYAQLSVDTVAGVAYLSGQAALGADVRLAEGDLAAQAGVARRNLATALAAVGATSADLLRLVTYVVRGGGDDAEGWGRV